MQISLCPLDRISDLQSFINNYWRQGHVLARDAELLRWQFPPVEDPEHLSVLIARQDGKILGFLGSIPMDFSHYGQRLPGMWLAMWMVVPELRSKFGGLRLLQAVNRDKYQIVACLGLNKNTGTIFPNRGFTIYESFPRWIGIISPTATSRILALHPDGYSPEALAAWQKAVQSMALQSPEKVRLMGWSENISGRWNKAWQERFAPRLIGTWKNAEFLRWRYIQHPRFNYIVNFAENTHTGDLAGLLVYRIETIKDRQEKVLRIVEFLSEDSATIALAQEIFDKGKAINAAFADFFCTSEIFAAPLESCGFVREDQMPTPLPRLFQPLDFRRTWVNGAFWVNPTVASDCQEFFRDGGLYVTTSDGDQDRPN